MRLGRLSRFWQEEFPPIPEKHRQRFLREIHHANWSRLKVILHFLAALALYEILVDIHLKDLWESLPHYRYFFWIDLILAGAVAVFVILFRIGTAYGDAETTRGPRLLVSSVAGFMLAWCAVVAGIENIAIGGMSTYVIGVFAVATAGYFRGWTLLLMYGLSLGILMASVEILQDDPVEFLPDFISLSPLLVLAWIISRLLFAARLKNFLAHRQISEANALLEEEIDERLQAEWALQAAHDQLERRVQERTRMFELANRQLRQEVEERKRAEEELKLSLQEKDALLREIHHRVKNNMQVISSLLELQVRHSGGKDPSSVIEESRGRIKSIALAHEMLYQSRNLARIRFRDYVTRLVATLSESYQGVGHRVATCLSIEDIELGIDTAIPCALVLNELISNSLKHAFPGERKGEIRLDIHQKSADLIEVLYSDDGIGMPKGLDWETSPSLGLKLVRGLVKHQLGGELTIRSDEGTEFLMRFEAISHSTSGSDHDEGKHSDR